MPDDDVDDDGRQWFGELDDRPALVSPASTATVSVRVENDLMLEYVGVDRLEEDGMLGPVAAGAIAVATCRKHGYRVVRVLAIDGDLDGADVELEVMGERLESGEVIG